jgi:hypothetical protein
MTLPPAIWICSPTRGRSDFNRASLEAMLAGHGLRPLEETPIDADVPRCGSSASALDYRLSTPVEN